MAEIKPVGTDTASGQNSLVDNPDILIINNVSSRPGSGGSDLFLQAFPGTNPGNLALWAGDSPDATDGGAIDILAGASDSGVGGNITINTYNTGNILMECTVDGSGNTGTINIGNDGRNKVHIYTFNGSDLQPVDDGEIHLKIGGDTPEILMRRSEMFVMTDTSDLTVEATGQTLFLTGSPVIISGLEQTQIGNDPDEGGLILVDRGGTQIGGLTGTPITLGPVYYDPNNGQLIRFGQSIFFEGDGTDNTINGRDADHFIDQILGTIGSIGSDDETFDLGAGPAIIGTPIVPGSVTIQVVLADDTGFSTVTDNGAGAFPSGAVLPSGGTIDYATGDLTGVTDVLESTSQVVAYYLTENASGEALTLRGEMVLELEMALILI